MMQSITCPSCQKGLISFDIHQLLKGEKFICPTCGAAVSLSAKSQPIVSNALDGLDKLKSNESK